MAIFDSGSPQQLLLKVVLTDYEKWELRNWKAHERCVKKAVEAAEDVESEEDRYDISSTRMWGRRVRGTQTKKRRVASSALSTDKEDYKPPVKFPICFFIEGPRLLAASSPQQGASATPTASFVVIKGPFPHTSDASFSKLLCSNPQYTLCNVNFLVLQSFIQKYNKPTNATEVPLTSEIGYKTLISLVKKKNGNFMVHVFMKPPSKDVVIDLFIQLILLNSHKHRVGPLETRQVLNH